MRFVYITFGILVVPLLTFAQGVTLASIITSITGIISTLSLAAIGLAFLVFVWGLVTFIASDIPNKKTEGKNRMVWGTVALFVLTSIFGIVKFLQDDIFGESMIPNGPTPSPDVDSPQDDLPV